MNLPLEAHQYRLIKERLLEQMPELADDEHCLLDTLEGCTDLNQQLAALARSAKHDEALASGITEYLNALKFRKDRMEERAQRKRELILRYMAECDIKKVEAPDLTLTRKAVPPKVIITDESQLPDRFKRWEWTPDKTKLKHELSEGTAVPGAQMSNGGETVQVKI